VAAGVPVAVEGEAVRGFGLAFVFGLVVFLGLRWLAGLEAAIWCHVVIVVGVLVILRLRL
jgi:hypothetical protein